MTYYLIAAGAGAALLLLVLRFLASRPKPALDEVRLPLESAPALSPVDADEIERQLLAAVSMFESKIQARWSSVALPDSAWFDGWLERCASIRRFMESNSRNPPSPIFGRGMSETSFEELIEPGYELDERIRQYLSARGL